MKVVFADPVRQLPGKIGEQWSIPANAAYSGRTLIHHHWQCEFVLPWFELFDPLIVQR